METDKIKKLKVSKDNTISILPIKTSWNREEVKEMYSVVPFPEVQEYMEEDWFDEEAILDVDNKLQLGSSTYLIPNKYITIHSVKDSWNREEVEELIFKYSSILLDLTDPFLDSFEIEKINPTKFTKKWIEENL